MRLKTPQFWYQDSVWAALLSPLSCVYLIGHKINQAQKPYRAKLPVICVGNAVAGGSGKTPAVMALIDLIKQNDIAKNPVILTRGYGGKLKGPVLVDPAQHSYRDVGDEALLLARKAPTIICANRAQGAQFIESLDADLIIMDDGLQNPSLHKDVSLLVVGANGFGNGKLLPAGPLREPLSDVIDRADAFITVENTSLFEKPTFTAQIEAPQKLESGPYIAFAGLGHPEKFKTTLESLDVDITGWYAFPDHYPYSAQDLQKLMQEAKDKNAQLITTEKDHVRIPPAFQKDIGVLPVHMAFENSDSIAVLIKNKISSLPDSFRQSI